MAGRLASLAASVALVASGFGAPAAAQQSDPTGGLPLAWPSSWSYGEGGYEELGLEFTLAEDLPAGTTVDLYLSGCREGRAREVFDINPLNPDGHMYPVTYPESMAKGDTLWGLWWLSNAHEDAYLGPDWTGVLSISRPGAEPWVWNFSHADFDFDPAKPLPSNDDTCPPERTPITVERWSEKKGPSRARVGKKLSVTPTHAAGSTVSYVWIVGRDSAVDRDRTMRVKKSYKGKRIVLKIAVSKPGLKSVTKKIRYGTAR